MSPRVRQLGASEAEAFAQLRRQALLDSPLAFSASPGDDFVSSAETVREQLRRAPDWVLFGAFDEALVGSVGLFRDHHLKSAHKAHLWGMYVAPEHRRRGFASELLEAALHHARALPGVSQVQLCVTSAAAEARRLYESAGFRQWGTEPEALRHEGQAVVEHHMVLRLD